MSLLLEIEKKRIESGMTKYRLSKLSGVPQQTYGRALKRGSCTMETYEKLAQVLIKSSASS